MIFIAYKKNKVFLLPRSNARYISIKCYEEQMPKGWGEVKKKIRSRNKSKMHVIGIKHDDDPDHNDFWGDSRLKPHYHIIVHVVAKAPMHVSTILKELGIVFRPHEDDELWKNHGIESIENWSNMAVYLTHETEKAMLDGKTLYDRKKLVSNLSPEEIQQIRDGYVRISNVGKVGNKEMAELDALAFKLGWELGDFGKWYGNLSFMERSHSKMRKVEESYNRGVAEKVEKEGQVNRLCVFIQGDHNEGKTYASNKAFKGKHVVEISTGGNGRFDDIRPYTEAVILNDSTAPNLLPMTDNYMCKVYRRNSDNPFWCGHYLIVTSNKSFREWASVCGIDTSSEEFNALCSRFYICHTVPHIDGGHVLYCDSPSTRGTKEEQEERLKMFCDFRDKVNASMLAYRPEKEKVDYSNINAIYAPTTQEEPEPEEALELPKKRWKDLGLIRKEDAPYYEAKGFVYSAESERYEHAERQEFYDLYENCYFH